jgi:hypothetical protein
LETRFSARVDDGPDVSTEALTDLQGAAGAAKKLAGFGRSA